MKVIEIFGKTNEEVKVFKNGIAVLTDEVCLCKKGIGDYTEKEVLKSFNTLRKRRLEGVSGDRFAEYNGLSVVLYSEVQTFGIMSNAGKQSLYVMIL